MNSQKLCISLAEIESERYKALNCKSGSQFNSGRTMLSANFTGDMCSFIFYMTISPSQEWITDTLYGSGFSEVFKNTCFLYPKEYF